MEESQIFLDYSTLKIIWWALLGVLLIGFAILGGLDIGVSCLMPVVSKSDMEKRILINSIGPVWESNQVWLILGAGVIFAAWPTLYSVAFSNFYYVMFLVLVSLILRPVGFDYRNKLENYTWRRVWDICLFFGGFIPALVFGIAFGNLFIGVKYNLDPYMFIENSTKVIDLFNPFGLFCGIFCVLMFSNHGAIYLLNKTEMKIHDRSLNIAKILPFLLVIMFVVGGWWVQKLPGFTITSNIDPNGIASPLYKTVSVGNGFWMRNFEAYPKLYAVTFLAVLMLLISWACVFKKYNKSAQFFSGVSIFCIVANAGITLFPFLLPSSTNPNVSLTVYDSSSTHLTLFVMLLVCILFIPIIISYVSWMYYVMRGKINADYIKDNSHSLY